MESSNSMPPEMDSPGEDIILMETVKNMVSHEGRNEAEGTEDFFLISQDQAVQYPEGNIEETMSHRHQTEVTLAWMHLCRICANASDRMISIFEGEGAQHDLISKILKYLPIHVTESDTLPLQLCERCANVLMAWHELNEGCLNAERKLLEMQDSHLQNKQEYYNPSLDNLEVTAPMFTTASTTIASNITTDITSNITDPLPSQQDDDKSGGCSIEKINKSDRLKNEVITHDRKIAHNYCQRVYKKGEQRNKINPIQTKTSNVIDENSENIFSPADNIDNDILTKCSSSTNTLSTMSSSDNLTNDNKKKSMEDEGSNSTSQMRTNYAKETTSNEATRQNLIAEVNESNEYLEKNVKQSKSKKVVCTSPSIVCKFCNKKFRSRKNHWAHVRTHSGEKSYTCHICGKQFVQGGSLYYHLKHVHDGVKNHTCDICGRSFAMKTAMEDHRRIHTGERPYVCHTCGKTFKTKASLYIHSKIHTDEFPHKCTYCAKKFRWRQQMLGHLTVHTGEKNHTCDVCGKGFGVKNDLTRHKRVHSEEKPYTCQKCGISFGQKRYLKSHERLKLGTCGYSQSELRDLCENRIESD
ncbi:PREDICTED: zinc finger protein 557-like isoform X2 [Acromyrmex echinatior]|uniref:zinc finger protein 557-like isoform X2 n=1 Tax=Acromyrmex echinatior TaxID=103372 RepID=UPI000580DCAC|nr:PREDICTED: zinc finger protein 557-like isoform X2 [Acromyrmex echinatior]